MLAACAAAIVFAFALGPVVLTLTATHGVHAGDALSGLPAACCALSLRRGLS